MKKTLSFFSILIFLISGCATSQKQLLVAEESQVKLRSIQTRSFETADKEKILRAVISTLQDLDFLIDKADLELGSITGTKFHGIAMLKMTVTVRPKNEKEMLVRANAQYGLKAVETPEPYQDFFVALEKSIFLAAHQVD